LTGGLRGKALIECAISNVTISLFGTFDTNLLLGIADEVEFFAGLVIAAFDYFNTLALNAPKIRIFTVLANHTGDALLCGFITDFVLFFAF
jgi:hypothetical protein